jgi:glucose-6-phosphate 1-dehydrogenase
MTNISGRFSFDIVVFGATGDLSLRKLMPALYLRDRAGQLEPDCRIIAAARSRMAREAFLAELADALARHLPAGEFDAAAWEIFAGRIRYLPMDIAAEADYAELGAALDEVAGVGESRILVYYLAVAPRLFGPVCANLAASRLNRPNARVVLEKPIGQDLASARQVNDAVGQAFAEASIYRIDHYLGKEAVQNLMALRFANALFEPIWHRGVV